MSQVKTLPRFIKPAEIMPGDVIRFVWEARGVEHARTARVHRKIEHNKAFALYTVEGAEIFHYVPSTFKGRVTLLAVEVPVEPEASLFDIDEMMEVRP